MKPEDAKVGMWVVYNGGPPGAKPEDGILTSWNDHYAFVRYNNMGCSQATNWDDLSAPFERFSK